MVDTDLLYSRILEYMQGGVLALDRKGHVVAFNPAAERMLGLTPERAAGHPFATALFDDPANDGFAQALLDAVYEADSRHDRDIAYHRDGQAIWLNLITSTLWSEGAPEHAAEKVGVVALFVDITERKRAAALLHRANAELEQRVRERTRQLEETNARLQREVAERIRAQEHIAHLAEHDALTGLPNRRRFEHALAAAVADAGAFAVLYLDLDDFKAVNDTFGHDTGDWLLKTVSRRLKNCVSERDTVARLGGDEFAIIVRSIRSHADVEPVVERIVRRVRAPYRTDAEHMIEIGISVGVALYPLAGSTPRELVQASDKAMYEIKRRRQETPKETPKEARKAPAADGAPASPGADPAPDDTPG